MKRLSRILRILWILPFLIVFWQCAPRPSVSTYLGSQAREYFQALQKHWKLPTPLDWSGQFNATFGPWGNVSGHFQLKSVQDSLEVTLQGPWGQRVMRWPLEDTFQAHPTARALILYWLLGTGKTDSLTIQTLRIRDSVFVFEGLYQGEQIQLKMDSAGRPRQIEMQGERLEIQAYNGQQPTQIHYAIGGGVLDLVIQETKNRKP